MSLNKNKVQLVGFYGSDLTHAQSAWTSTQRDLTKDKIKRIPALLKMLADNGHHSVFEKSSFHFLVDTDIASHIHLLKHRVGVSMNGESARYKEIKEDKYIVPDDWLGIKRTNDEDFESENSDVFWSDALICYTELGNKLYHSCLKDLESTLGRKRAKESARFFKTYNSQIQADIMFNWRSFYHFLNLRNKPDAQKEIKDIAFEMLNLVRNISGDPFKYTIEAFGLLEKPLDNP